MHFQKTCLFVILCWLDLALSVYGAANYVAPHEKRDTVKSHVLNASIIIRDHSGIDVTPRFKIMVNHQDQSHIFDNHTENSLHDRQATVGRIINACPDGEAFIQSHCAPNGDRANSLQRYIYTCKKNITSHRGGPRRARLRTSEGYCADQEVCYDIRTDNPAIVVASCSPSDMFEQWYQDKSGRTRALVNGETFDPVVSLYGVMSGSDGSTTIQMDALTVNTSSGDGGATKGQVQSKTCRSCAEIETDLLAPTTDSLKLEARLMNGASNAALGILWLTLVTAAG